MPRKRQGYPGVNKNGNLWAASISTCGHPFHLGGFETEKEAVAARRLAENFKKSTGKKDVFAMALFSESMKKFAKDKREGKELSDEFIELSEMLAELTQE